MQRRNFLVSAALVLGTVKAALKSKDAKPTSLGHGQYLIGDRQDYVYLKRNEIYLLPENPSPISSVINFDVRKYRFGKSPEIKFNGNKLNGNLVDKIILAEDVQLYNNTHFTLQYTGEDIGWVLLV